MIIDTLTGAEQNPFYPAAIRKALRAIIQQEPHTLPAGKYTVDGDNIFFNVVEGETHPLAGLRPEFHRHYIDIHIVLVGEEIIGAGNRGLEIVADGEFNAAHDIGFCTQINSETLIHLHPGELAVLFPGELHRPMGSLGEGAPLRKIIVKVDGGLI